MAIQIPNPGTGNGATGDNEFVLWSKVEDNFNDQTNAASRLVGVANSQIPLSQQTFEAAFTRVTNAANSSFDAKTFANGTVYLVTPSTVSAPAGITGAVCYTQAAHSSASDVKMQIAYDYINGTMFVRGLRSAAPDAPWNKYYHTGNTTKDAGTGFLKVSSPVLHVYNDKIDKIHEAEQLDITVDKKGVGHYEIYGTTGLRQNDGWNMSPPRDIHGNVRCMIEVTEKDGVITVKTYKRKFDLELAAIVHDYDNPLDIPEGACVELRFNDLPYENLDDIQTEV